MISSIETPVRQHRPAVSSSEHPRSTFLQRKGSNCSVKSAKFAGESNVGPVGTGVDAHSQFPPTSQRGHPSTKPLPPLPPLPPPSDMIDQPDRQQERASDATRANPPICQKPRAVPQIAANGRIDRKGRLWISPDTDDDEASPTSQWSRLSKIPETDYDGGLCNAPCPASTKLVDPLRDASKEAVCSPTQHCEDNSSRCSELQELFATAALPTSRVNDWAGVVVREHDDPSSIYGNGLLQSTEMDTNCSAFCPNPSQPVKSRSKSKPQHRTVRLSPHDLKHSTRFPAGSSVLLYKLEKSIRQLELRIRQQEAKERSHEQAVKS